MIESETATIVGSPSGTAATISTILVINASIIESKLILFVTANEISCATNTIAAAQTPIIVIVLPSLASFS